MRIATGTVIDGKIVVDGDPPTDGTRVTVLSVDEEEFDLDADSERELVAALGEAQSGQGVDGDLFLAQLDAQ